MYTYTYMYVYMCVCVYIYICAVIPHTALLSHSELPQGKFLHRDSPNQKSHLSQPNKSFVFTALHDSFVIASWPLMVVCCYSLLVLWLSPSAGIIAGISTLLENVWFSVSFVVKPKAPLVSIVSSQMCLKTAENGKNACAAKRACHISTICCVSHL